MGVYWLTIWYLVPSFTWLSQPSKCAVSMDVQRHSKQKDDLTHHETRIKEPRRVIVYKVCEVPALHVAVYDAEEEGTNHWNNGSMIALHQQRVDEHPVRSKVRFYEPYSTNPRKDVAMCDTESDPHYVYSWLAGL